MTILVMGREGGAREMRVRVKVPPRAPCVNEGLRVRGKRAMAESDFVGEGNRNDMRVKAPSARITCRTVSECRRINRSKRLTGYK